MTIRRYLIGAGTAGADATAAATGASVISRQGASTAKFEVGRGGRLGVRFVNGVGTTGSSQNLNRFPAASTTQTEGQVTFGVELPSAVTTQNPVSMMTARHSSGPILSVQQLPSGAVAVYDSAGTPLGNLLTAAQAVPGSEITVAVDWVGGSTTAGQVTAEVYNLAGTKIGSTVTSSAANLTANAFASVDVGVVSANNAAGNDPLIQDLQLNDEAGALLAPYVAGANEPPTVTTGGSVTVNSGGTASLTSAATDPDGSVATRQWSWDTRPAGAALPTFTSPTSVSTSTSALTTPGLYVARMTVTDNQGASASAIQKVFVPATTAVPILVNHNNGAWVNVGGATDLAAALADTSTATYAESPNATGTEQAMRVRLAPLFPGTSFALAVDDLLSAAGTATAKVRLWEGSTMRKEWTVSPSTTVASGTVTMSSAECATVTSWNELDVEFAWSL